MPEESVYFCHFVVHHVYPFGFKPFLHQGRCSKVLPAGELPQPVYHPVCRYDGIGMVTMV